jgi:hypothetical protein
MNAMKFWYHPAFVAAVTGSTKVRIWLEHPQKNEINYNFNKTHELDLSKTPSNRSIRWDEIEVDDHINSIHHGYTSLGPLFPHAYGSAGIYLSDVYCDKYGIDRHEIKTETTTETRHEALAGYLHERIALVRRNNGQIERFHGFHVDKDLTPDETQSKILVIPHADTSLEKRARRVLRVPRDKRLLVDTRNDTSDLTNRGIYLDRRFAQDSSLDVPKRPSGSSEGKRAKSTDNPPPAPVPGGPLNVFGYSISDEVQRIQETLDGNWTYLRGGDLAGLLNGLSSNGKYTSLDLIGHSRSGDSVLKIGELPFLPDVATKMLTVDVVKTLAARGVRQIRLLGCRTSCSATARESIKRMVEQVTKAGETIEVLGTRGDIFAVHYDKGYGFAEEGLLVPQYVSLNGGPGDASPTDDEPIVTPSQSHTGPAPQLDVFDRLPMANLALARPLDGDAPYALWRLADLSFDYLKQLIDWEGGVETDLAEEPDRELVVVNTDRDVLRSLAVFFRDPKRPRVRISFDNICYSYPITYGPRRPETPQLRRLLELLGRQ